MIPVVQFKQTCNQSCVLQPTGPFCVKYSGLGMAPATKSLWRKEQDFPCKAKKYYTGYSGQKSLNEEQLVDCYTYRNETIGCESIVQLESAERCRASVSLLCLGWRLATLLLCLIPSGVLGISETSLETPNVPDNEIACLHDLYSSTNGDSWTWHDATAAGNKWNFTDPNPCADAWQGIICSTAPTTAGYLHIRKVQLPAFALNGAIPASLGNLSELQVLDLSSNSLSGRIPDTLGNCTQLSELFLFDNHLIGNIPDSLGQCTQLAEIDLNTNYLTGHIPDSLGQCALLQMLYLYTNQLSGRVPATLGNCTQLTELGLFSNELTGSIPSTLGQCTKLSFLYLSLNRLTGSIPDALGNCAQLTVMYLYSNQLSGRVPDSLGNCTKLTELGLIYNQLTGSIPAALGQCTQLSLLYLNYNQLTGNIPDTLRHCTQLTGLYLGNNYMLTGRIPEFFGDYTHLIELDLEYNQLTGSIPSTLGQCKQLTALYLHHNQLTGHIPASLGQCTQLTSVYLDNNHITGSIPDTLGNCTHLTVVYFYSNQLSGLIPPTLGKCTHLQYLILYDNQLTGQIPDTLGQCTQLKILYLYNNQLTGSIPSTLEQCTSLLQIQISNNQITGTLPKFWLSSVHSSLQFMNCRNNLLTGFIPEVQGGELKFKLLDWSYNMLSGTLPSSFVSALSDIYKLYANNNLLSGSLPQNWTAASHTIKLLHLDLNRLTGSLPASLGHLPHLLSLNLSSNRLTGTIPATFQQLGALESLLLKNNQLRGSITQVFNPAQRNLSVVQLSNNQLTGTLPAAAFLLPRLSSFAAVDNCLEGPLPEDAICSSTSLNSLVLDGMHSASGCSSHLSTLSSVKGLILGALPQCLLTMSALTTLHLSGSGLTGSLPTGANISTVLSDLSLSHNLLTGKVPEIILGRDWAKLDLSYNRLTGTLSSARGAPYGNGTQLSLQQNRLSGVIPSSVKRVGILTLLESNLFSCRVDRSDVPQQDPGSGKYTCGSDAVNNALYAWLGVSLGAAVATIAWHRSPLRETTKRWLSAVQGDRLPGFGYILRVACALRSLGAASAAYCILVLLPVYAVVDTYHPTFTYQYAWTVSGAYLSGTTAFVVEAIFLAFLLAGLGWLIDRLGWLVKQEKTSSTPVENTSAVVSDKSCDQRTCTYALLMVVSLSVVASINVGFVFATLQLTGRELTFIQTLLALFKLGFNHFVAPAIKRRATWRMSDKDSKDSLSYQVSTSEVLLVLLNVIVIPCLVVLLISPSCLYDALKGSDSVTSSYKFVGACDGVILDTNINGQITDGHCTSLRLEEVSTSYTPPFAYSYQCSSSFVTYYAPTYVIMCIISGFLVPAQHLLLLWLQRNLPPSSRVHYLVTVVAPRILRELESPEELVKSLSDPWIRPVFNANRLVISLLTYLALLLTFGALFPPLAVCCAVAMASVVLVARLEVARYVSAAVVADRQDCVDEIERTCVEVAPPQQLRIALDMVMVVSCLFYTLFLFDTLGDEVGFTKAFWVLLVVPAAPLLVLTLRSADTTHTEAAELSRSPTEMTADADPELGVELADVATVGRLKGGGADHAAILSFPSSNPMHVT